MPVNLTPPRREELLPVAGVELGWAEAGIRKANRKDLLVIRLAAGANVAGVFTRNRFAAAPVQVCREHLAGGSIRALIINTGNANAGTGVPGLAAARSTCDAAARLLGVDAGAILPFSTGVIMEPLPVDRLIAGLPDAMQALAAGPLVRSRRSDHDDGHGSQGGFATRSHRHTHGDDHGHREGCRDDSPRHGDDAGLHRHGLRRAPRLPAGHDANTLPGSRSIASRSMAIRRPTTPSWSSPAARDR